MTLIHSNYFNFSTIIHTQEKLCRKKEFYSEGFGEMLGVTQEKKNRCISQK